MVIYKRKNFTKALYLVVQKSITHQSYSFCIYRRDGKYIIYQSRYFKDLYECIDQAIIKINFLSEELKKDNGLIKLPKDYVPN